MMPEDDVVHDIVERAVSVARRADRRIRPTPTPNVVARCLGVGLTGAALALLAPAGAASADSPLADLLGKVTDGASQLVDPVVAPIVGGLLGNTPTGTVLAPVTGVVDGVLDGLDGTPTGDTPGTVPGDPGGHAPETPGDPNATDGSTSGTHPQWAAWAAAVTAGITPAQLAAANATDDGTSPDIAEPAGDRIRPGDGREQLVIITPPLAWSPSPFVPPSTDADYHFAPYLLVLLLGFTAHTRSRAPPSPAHKVGSMPD